MAQCDVCGKTTLMPEKFGKVNICKVCFIKINGPFWKHQFERYEDAEIHRRKVTEAMQKQSFPQNASSAIDKYFIDQMAAMRKCDCCGQPVQHIQALGKSKICNQCFSKINTSAWKEVEYEQNEDVEKNRQKLLKTASKNGFPPIIVDEINAHFDKKLQKGLICILDGNNGQKLKVYKTHCILLTTGDFDAEKASKAYGRILKSSQPKANLISNSDAKALAHSVLRGGVVKTGVKLATSVFIDMAADAIVPEKSLFKVVSGNFRIDYRVFDYVEYHRRGENEVGYIRFVYKSSNGHGAEDIVFFFENDNKKIANAYEKIRSCIDATCKSHYDNDESLPPPKKSQVSVADEILKFKQLLDMGAITQKEFERKKKELLKK